MGRGCIRCRYRSCRLLGVEKRTLSSLYRLRTPDIYRSYLDDSATKRKLALKKKEQFYCSTLFGSREDLIFVFFIV